LIWTSTILDVIKKGSIDMDPIDLIDQALQKLEDQCEERGVRKAVLTVSIAELLIAAKKLIAEKKEKNQNGSET